MSKLALTAQIRNVLLVSLTTLTLAACGGGSGSSSSATASADTATATTQPNVGTIDRSEGLDENDGAQVASNTTSTPPSTATTTPATGSSSSGGTSATNTGSKATTPVKTINGVATLDWMPPTSNSDGSVLTNLAGYTVYYGTSPNDLSKTIKVSNPGLTAYTVEGLTSGKWYFAVTAHSADGVESNRTVTVSTTI